MAELSQEIVGDVVDACKAGADKAAGALSRALDAEVRLSVGEPGKIDLEALPDGFDGAGLAIVLVKAGAGALVLVPESSGVLPSWCASADSTGQTKLESLAQELGTAILPEQCQPDDSRWLYAEILGDVVARGGVSQQSSMVPLDIERADGAKATACLVWPATDPATVIGEKETARKSPSDAEANSESGSPQEPVAQPKAVPRPNQDGGPRRASMNDLPNYSRSLLKIKLPVVVTLARRRQPLGRVIELGPGSILQFEKSCEEMLELDVGGRTIAVGEAVKIGDKFGLRISSMVLPGESFDSVKKEARKAG
ncbi:MAG: FliM/FliN family flagellar motor switch protein [Planctomycetota bacterium]|jgi:flagellar motor switch/type III secretory pathway protein FliN